MRPLRRLELTRIVAALALTGCALPAHVLRAPTSAIGDTGQTRLGALVAPALAAHPLESGFLLYDDGEGALAARVALADVAQASIDAQYFQWAGDTVGRVVLEHVMAAADRGVRVRLLIDDYSDRGNDLAFATLAAHPNIEVRVFNPLARGRLFLTQMLGRFTELNHRMHNKMFVVDGQAVIVGGRNLTDDYFGLGKEIDFRDFDLLAFGPVVRQAEGGFDSYWNSRWAYPIGSLRKAPALEERERSYARFRAHLAADRAHFPYVLPRNPEESLARLERSLGGAIWGEAELVYDDPSVMAQALDAPPGVVWRKLAELVAQAEHEIVAENAYFLPDEHAPALGRLRARGVEVRVLTNSLASTDVVAVNAHYAATRRPIVDRGVALFEMKPWAESRRRHVARAASSKARLSLHAKAAVIDRRIVFVGSFNFDPRSRSLDTEIVFIVRSPQLAEQLLCAFQADFAPQNAWRIGAVARRGSVAWITERPERVEVEPHDPAGAWRRFVKSVAGILPLRSLL